MTNVPGLFVIGEANFSDHGANRLGASSLMQGLADGYFVLPNTLPNYLAGQMGKRPSPDSPEFREAEKDVRARIEKFLWCGKNSGGMCACWVGTKTLTSPWNAPGGSPISSNSPS